VSTGGGLPWGVQIRQRNGEDLNRLDMDSWGRVPRNGTNGDGNTQSNMGVILHTPTMMVLIFADAIPWELTGLVGHRLKPLGFAPRVEDICSK
jgi:hypothetical protein